MSMDNNQLNQALKKCFNTYKQEEIFEKIANEIMGSVQNLRKQIGFNNLTDYFKGNSDPKELSVQKVHQLFRKI